MFDNRVDGLLVSLSYDTDDLSHFEPFFRKNIPLIFFDRVKVVEKCANITINNKRAAYNAVTHLIKGGCKRIIHITATPTQNVYVDRLKGYKQALAKHKLPFNEQQLIITSLSYESGATAAKEILQMRPLPDGVFVANDNCAVGCMLALKQAGIRIPKDIAFVGFNNDPVSKVIEPNLTTINYPGYEMGKVACQQLINHLNGKAAITAADSIVLKSDLIVRDSA